MRLQAKLKISLITIVGKIVLQSNATYSRYTRYLSLESDLEADDFETKSPEFLIIEKLDN